MSKEILNMKMRNMDMTSGSFAMQVQNFVAIPSLIVHMCAWSGGGVNPSVSYTYA
jgi:hypothetical protein